MKPININKEFNKSFVGKLDNEIFVSRNICSHNAIVLTIRFYYAEHNLFALHSIYSLQFPEIFAFALGFYK